MTDMPANTDSPLSVSSVEAEARALLAKSQGLNASIQCLILDTLGFNEKKQEAWCRWCKDRDPHRLHDPECPIYVLHGAWEEWLAAGALLEARTPQQTEQDNECLREGSTVPVPEPEATPKGACCPCELGDEPWHWPHGGVCKVGADMPVKGDR